jgi:hypothetical protein
MHYTLENIHSLQMLIQVAWLEGLVRVYFGTRTTIHALHVTPAGVPCSPALPQPPSCRVAVMGSVCCNAPSIMLLDMMNVGQTCCPARDKGLQQTMHHPDSTWVTWLGAYWPLPGSHTRVVGVICCEYWACNHILLIPGRVYAGRVASLVLLDRQVSGMVPSAVRAGCVLPSTT